jgi:hypothetical protein
MAVFITLGSPVLKGIAIESEKKSLAKLFDGGQPCWVARKRSSAHSEANVFATIALFIPQRLAICAL